MLVVVWQGEGSNSAERKRQIERTAEEEGEVMVIVVVQGCYDNMKGDFRWSNLNRMVVLEEILMEGWWDIVVLTMPMVILKTIVGVERR